MSKYEIENVKLTAPKLDRNDLEYAMTYRYACKKFDSNKKISEEDWNAILNAARLSPTSLGFEAYQLLVIQIQKFAKNESSWLGDFSRS